MNGIDAESLVNGIADKLKSIFPDYAVYDDKIPQKGFENCFHIGVMLAGQKRVMGNRYKRSYDFTISFYPAEESVERFYVWERKMLEHFEFLDVCGEVFHVTDAEISESDGVWQMVFALSFFVLKIEETALMEDLTLQRAAERGVLNGS